MAILAAVPQDANANPSGKIRRQRARITSAGDGAQSPSPHPHPYKKAASTPTHSFRPNTNDQPQTLCAVCLRKPHQNMAECREETLGDGQPAFSTRSKLGHLTDRQGKSLCVDFQLPKGCSSKHHGTRHRCAGCGNDQHGAVECHRRQAN